jgi:hypothetical protein
MEGDPKKLAMLIMAKGKGGEEKKEADDFDDGESSSGADAFAEAVKLAMKGDKAAAFDALKVAVSSCSEDYE